MIISIIDSNYIVSLNKLFSNFLQYKMKSYSESCAFKIKNKFHNEHFYFT